MWIRTEKEQDLKPLAERDKILTKEIGVKVPVRYFHDTYGIPEPEGDEETVGGVDPRASESAARPRFSPAINPAQRLEGEFAERKKTFTPDQQALEDFADMVIPEAAAVMAGNEAKIRAAIEQAGSYEEAMAALLDLYPALDVDDLEKIMEKTLLNAKLYGMATVTQ